MPKKSVKPEICVHRAYTGEKDVEDLIVEAYSAYFEDMMRLKSSGDTFALPDEESYNGVNENCKEEEDDGSAA